MMSFSRFPAILIFRAILLISVAPVFSQTEDKAKLIEGAKKEDKLIWYTSTNVTESKPLWTISKSNIHSLRAKSFAPAARKRSIAS